MKKRTDPNLAYWRGVLKSAEQELEAATGNTSLKEAARRYMRAKAEVKRLEQEASAQVCAAHARLHNPEQMTCKDDHLSCFIGAQWSDVAVAPRVLVRADGACEELAFSQLLGLLSRRIGKGPYIRLKSLLHERDPYPAIPKASGRSHRHLNLLERLKDGHLVITSDEGVPYLVSDRGVDQFPTKGPRLHVLRNVGGRLKPSPPPAQPPP